MNAADLINRDSSSIPANTTQDRRRFPLVTCELFHVFSFLEPRDLVHFERVNKIFEDAIGYQWRSRCRDCYGLPPKDDLKLFLPEALNAKESVLLVSDNDFAKKILLSSQNIFDKSALLLSKDIFEETRLLSFQRTFDETFYKLYIGYVDLKPASLRNKLQFILNYHKPDPFDPTKKIGKEYILMYIPEYITINRKDISLDKADDPNDTDAPRLIRRAANSELVQSENTTLKVPVTINNLRELFRQPRRGNPANCDIWDQIVIQHGNKRSAARWIYMRKNLIGKNLSYNQQLALARDQGVVPTELISRILFNLLVQVQSPNPNTYLDGSKPWTFARTQTLTNNFWSPPDPSGCGNGSNLGLLIHNSSIDGDNVGLAVELPSRV